MLHYRLHSAQQKTDKLLVMLHGFISDHRTYEAHLNRLTEWANVLVVDLPGHGQDDSPISVTWDFDWIIGQLDEVLSRYSEYRIYLQGYSMGARVALYYALEHQDSITALILESGSPGIRETEQREERVKVDNARARVLELVGIKVFVNDWEKLPLFKTQYDLPEKVRHTIREQRMSQNPQRLAKALKDYGTGQMPNLWPKLKSLSVPVSIIVGTLDEKFVNIGRDMISELPNGFLNEVSNVGHTVHVEDTAKFDTIIKDVLLVN
ncbi:2-succinyl-6-hydroxy-2,4-cyclohexadiene-1-carboxylate synthase [Staphylococcus canis]|uniref:Putative 2-succinyl-6-hydroxy-2,4-cyclohexadiene-1-carboxylate synthase n=1 Tax=Staphylococcus canis TaxID=2724942 RepID=A0ABS0TB99_9STAP|nr:2-succinyl-6-hydroxy-2,4-cyclohexadiene-1-carboxylate synthase [Staphylococcus canis]MBI5975957.1 2-succinyl-6-hydroxy-2,4-cyclohexadiene-1-carboxylate synthase [Staphylococcus canis]